MNHLTGNMGARHHRKENCIKLALSILVVVIVHFFFPLIFVFLCRCIPQDRRGQRISVFCRGCFQTSGTSMCAENWAQTEGDRITGKVLRLMSFGLVLNVRMIDWFDSGFAGLFRRVIQLSISAWWWEKNVVGIKMAVNPGKMEGLAQGTHADAVKIRRNLREWIDRRGDSY